MNIAFDKIGHVLFLDIETVSQHHSYDVLDERGQLLWESKIKYLVTPEDRPRDLYTQRAAIHAEFGKIICISVGIIFGEERNKVKISTFTGDEVNILLEFKKLIETHFFSTQKHRFCGHNLKEFDIPYICRRMVSLGIEIPDVLQVSGKKPWQLPYMIDTLELWKFGDYKNYTSLDLMTYAMGIDTPKTDIDGSLVGEIYYDDDKDNNIIYQYCERDVLAVIQIIMKLSNLPQMELDNVIFSID